MKKLSIRLKITLWFSVILILVVALTYLVILSVSGQIIQKTIRDNLIQTVESNVDEVEYYSSADMATLRNDVDYYVRYGDGYIEIDDDFLDQVNGVYTSLCSVDGDLIYGENPIIRETADLEFLDSQVQRITVDGTLYYVFDRKPETEGLEEMWLRGVVSENQGDAEMSDISRYSLILLPSLVLIAIIGGYLIACRMLRPIRQIADTAEQISQGDDLKKRIVLNEGDDELHRLAGQFNDMFARLDTSFQTQQQFVSDASHELRTPVAVINAQCELTLEQERTPEEYEEAMRVVWRQGRKMNRLINSMLDFTRLKLQPEKYTKEKMNLSELTDSVCQDMALIREKEIALTCEVEPDVYCLGNRELLTRLLNNLISNAYRYGKENGQIRVTLTTDKDGKITLSVQDDGIGIAAEDLPHIFNRFYQADGSRSSGGSGLGLAMAQEIAVFHEGQISVDSAPGAGSIFSVHLNRYLS
ncbi:MAG: HAMP domain-containing histidine kinase [Lachnospiraceae bacterium]|nr:HAMP domain-containing histidine kinase [Lachnospiraceae bacterium]